MVNKPTLPTELSVVKERPVFIPPRKRQTSKKANGTQNYVDHIVSMQNRQKLSPSTLGLDDDLLKTSLLLKNKQPLPELPPFTNNDLRVDGKTMINTSTQYCAKSLQSVDNIYEDESELHNFERISQCTKSTNRHESSTVTPSSYYSESSLDAKLSKSQDCLSTRSSAKKRVNIRTDLLHVRSARNSPEIANYEDLESGETCILNNDMDEGHSLERYNTRKSFDSNYLTMTGTIKRGRKKGQCLDLQINISREELEQINAMAVATEVKKRQNLCCRCTFNTGLHILLLSVVALPFVTLISGSYAFYIGTLTWYNMFNYFNEEKTYFLKLFMSPILILSYPVGIILCTLGLGIYSGLVQISLQFNSWLNEVADIEKGFYGWLCSFLHLSDCSPYEVVILTEILPQPQPDRVDRVNVGIEGSL